MPGSIIQPPWKLLDTIQWALLIEQYEQSLFADPHHGSCCIHPSESWDERVKIGKDWENCKDSGRQTFMRKNFPDEVQMLFPDCPETFQSVWNFFKPSGNFPDCPETFQTYTMFWLDFRVNFVNTRKNFPDAQKLSGRQCRCADGVFLPLVTHWVTEWLSDSLLERLVTLKIALKSP